MLKTISDSNHYKNNQGDAKGGNIEKMKILTNNTNSPNISIMELTQGGGSRGEVTNAGIIGVPIFGPGGIKLSSKYDI